MKTIKNCFDSMVNVINIEFAIQDAFRRKHRNKKSNELYYQRFKSACMIRKLVLSGEYPKQYPREVKTIVESSARKERQIIKPEEIEHVIHHMVCQELAPYFQRSFYPFCVASVPGRGDAYGVKYMRKWINKFVQSKKKFYVLKLDIRKFFYSIDRYIMFNKLKRIIKDDRMLEIIHKIIWYDNDYTAKGLPIGFYSSQWFANYYLQDLDYYIMHTLKNRYGCKELKMMRYADDIVILGYNKKKLHKIFKDISLYCKNELNLTIKHNWQVFPFIHESKKAKTYGKTIGRAIDYMGFVFHPNRTTLRKTTLYRARKKANNIKRALHRGSRLNWYMCSQMLSRISRMLRANTFNYYNKYIEPIITKKDCIECIRSFAKASNLKTKQQLSSDTKNPYTSLIVDSFKILYNKIRGECKYEFSISKIRKWIHTNLSRLYFLPFPCIS